MVALDGGSVACIMMHGTTMRSKNVTFRLYGAQIDQIQRAAALVEKSLSDYCRDILIVRAAADLGEEPMRLAPKRGRHNSPLERAAREQGISPAELEEQLLLLYSKAQAKPGPAPVTHKRRRRPEGA